MNLCSFALNGEPMSCFTINSRSFPAFSGLEELVNKRSSMCVAARGPIPVGTYYIVDRESGGRLGWLRDLLKGSSDWFALYADDGRIDDRTYCDQVQRGQFRLHPRVGRGISKGCITLDKVSDFHFVRNVLKSTPKTPISGSNTMHYGVVTVR
jgi:hypothetical protein